MGKSDKLDGPFFFKKTSDAEAQLAQLKEFLKTAPDSVKSQVEQDIKMLSYGIKGEENVAFELMNSFMPIVILHDLHYEYEGRTAQIDYFVITRKLFLLIECKNLIGNIEVTSSGEFIRTMEFGSKKIREGIYSPITQNQRHLDLIRKIRLDSKSNIITRIIIDRYFDDMYRSIVVLSNPKTVINMKYAKKDIKQQIIRCDQLVEYIKNLVRKSKEPSFSDKEMYTFAERYLSYHTPNTTDYLKKYKLPQAEETVIEKQASTHRVEDSPVYQALKQFRSVRSKEESVKPYFIYNNAQLEDLINLMPKTVDEIKLVSGFGDVKCEKYGKEILAIIDKHR